MSASKCFLGEIRMFGGNFAPKTWTFCNGQILSADQYPDLYRLIGNKYGGEKNSTFALPDLRGRIPVCMGQGKDLTARSLGEKGGVESVTLTDSELPLHNHRWQAGADGANSNSPEGRVLGNVSPYLFYKSHSGTEKYLAFSPEVVGKTGGGGPHSNIMPCCCVSFIIALSGDYPVQE